MICGVTKSPWRWLLWLPYFVIYTHWLPRRAAGAAWGPFIRIHPEYYRDDALLLHERIHVAQWWKAVILFFPFASILLVLWYYGAFIFFMPTLLLYAAWRMVVFANHQRCEAEAFVEEHKLLGNPINKDSEQFFDDFIESYEIRLRKSEVKAMFLS